MDQENGFLETRRRALEEQFFHKDNQRLLERLREVSKMKKAREALAEASGISKDSILEKLLELGIQAETVAALALVPLVEVAWADGDLDDKEKQTVLKAARASGLAEKSLAYALVESSLARWPRRRLRAAWRSYMEGLCAQLSQEDRDSLKADWLGRAEAVAEASAGFLGVGPRISKAEAGVLKEFGKAFQSP